MKKILLIAAVAAMIFPACTKENNSHEAGTLNVVVKIPNVQPMTRAIGDPGVTPAVTIPIKDGTIFIIGPNGNILRKETLDVSLAGTTTGQVILAVPSTSKIFVLGNVPDDVDIDIPQTLEALLATTSDIFDQGDYKVPALGNVKALPVGIKAISETEGEAAVVIHPLYSRIELASVKGGTNVGGDKVTAFTITGVWVDAWHPLFTMAGSNAGTIYNQLTGIDFSSNKMGEAGNWAATEVSNVMTAVPAAGKVWYNHVPAGGLPRLIIRVEGVKYQPATGDEVDMTSEGPLYITVKSYVSNGDPIVKFDAGHIYKIGGTAGITFNAPDNVYPNPNPGNIDIELTVEIEDWIIVNPEAILY